MKITIDVKEPFDEGVIQILIATANNRGGVDCVTGYGDLKKHDALAMVVDEDGFSVKNAGTNTSEDETIDKTIEFLERLADTIDEYLKEDDE